MTQSVWLPLQGPEPLSYITAIYHAWSSSTGHRGHTTITGMSYLACWMGWLVLSHQYHWEMDMESCMYAHVHPASWLWREGREADCGGGGWEKRRVWWGKATINSLINSMQRRCVAPHEANGGHTRYWLVFWSTPILKKKGICDKQLHICISSHVKSIK